MNTSRPHGLTQDDANRSIGHDTSTDLEFLGHPKLDKLKEVVLEHFHKMKRDNVETRVMIFSQYRDSVQEITACLHKYRPMIKVMEFVGQAGAKGKIFKC